MSRTVPALGALLMVLLLAAVSGAGLVAPAALAEVEPVPTAVAGQTDPIQAAVEVLNATGGDLNAFPAAIVPKISGAPPSASNPLNNAWAQTADLAGDGRLEWIVSIPSPARSCAVGDAACRSQAVACLPGVCPGLIALFGRGPNEFVPLASLAVVDSPTLYATQDLLGDGRRDLMITGSLCGASTCTTSLLVGQWDGRAWRNLADGPIQQASTQISVVDGQTGSPKQIQLYGGLAGSVGAGFQRKHRLTYAYGTQDRLYHLASDVADEDPDPYFEVLDANVALARSDLDHAFALASSAFEDPSPRDSPDWSEPVVGRRNDRIAAYAAIEIMLVQALRGDTDGLAAMADRVSGGFDPSDNAYVPAAQTLAQVYDDTGDPLAACGAMADAVGARADQAEFLAWYGYNTDRLSPDAVCPLPHSS